MDLRTLTIIDSLQPQVTGFLQTICQGFMPLERQAALFLEISPGIAINQITDRVLKSTSCQPGMQIVERAYGLLEVHHEDQGQVQHAAEVAAQELDVKIEHRLIPKIMSSQIITGIDGKQSQLINRMRHGDMIVAGQSLYILEVHPAGYAAIAANEAEKAAEVNILEFRCSGAYGRLWLGGGEAEVHEAAQAAESYLRGISGRENP